MKKIYGPNKQKKIKMTLEIDTPYFTSPQDHTTIFHYA